MNVIKILKDWTLPVAITTGAVVYLLFASAPIPDDVTVRLSSLVDFLMPSAMFLVLFVTFCKVDFHKMRLVPWHLSVSLFQLLITVLIVAPIVGFNITGTGLILMESVLLCNINPCATAAAVVVKKIGGDIEEMTAFTFLSNIIAAVLIPLFFPVVDRSADMTFMQAFLIILNKVFIVLVSPMILAYIVKHFVPRLHRRIIGVKDLAYYLWAFTLMLVTGATVRNIVHARVSVMLLLAIALLALAICVLQFAAGRFIGRYTGNPINTGQALGQKNTTIAIWLACTYLNPVSAVGPGCYILWQNIINSVEIWHYGRAKSK
ncbi:MAG: transporter [Prevotella sp.]